MANDAKWMIREEELDFVPVPGMDFNGLVGEQPLRISGLSYDIVSKSFKIRLAWLSPDPLDSLVMIDMGWNLADS